MTWNAIDSRQNDAVKFAASLSEKKARDEAGAFFADGSSILFDLAAVGVTPVRVYLSRASSVSPERIEAAVQGTDCTLYLLSESAFEKITAQKGSEGVACVYDRSAVLQSCPLRQYRRLVALENVQDPGNVGAVIRCAAAFGFDGVLLSGGADPFGPKAVRASMGAIARVPLAFFPDSAAMFSFLNEKSVVSVASALSPSAAPLSEMRWPKSLCLWIGNEGRGLSDFALQTIPSKVIIPMKNMESLNAATAAAVLLWEAQKEKNYNNASSRP